MQDLLSVGKAVGLSPPSLPPQMSAMGKEADQLWRALDRLAATDPAGYQQFVQAAAAEGGAAQGGGGGGSAAPKTLAPLPGYCVWVHPRGEAGQASSAAALHVGPGAPRPPRQLRPSWLASGTQLYINVCFHDRIDAPRTASGQAAPQQGRLALQELFNLNIPLALAPARRLAGSGAAPVGAIDVLAHPYIQQALAWEPAFKREYTAFVLDAVADELQVELQRGAWVEEPCAHTPYKGLGGDGKPMPFPISPPPSVAQELGLGSGAQGGRRAPAAGAGAASASADAGVAELTDLLRHLEASSSSSDSSAATPLPLAEEAEAGGLAALQSVGKRLAAGGGGGSSSSAPAARALPQDPGAAQAQDFAKFVTSVLPTAALLYDAAVKGVSFSRAPPRGLAVCIAFDADRVALGAPGFLTQAELEVQAGRVCLSIPPAFLPGYAGLSMAAVPVLAAELPEGLQCIPDTARARLAKRGGTLTVTCELLA